MFVVLCLDRLAANMAEIANDSLNDESLNGSSLIATDVRNAQDSIEESVRDATGKTLRRADTEVLQTASGDNLQPDQDESAAFDPDELEIEDDDITTKLLSIQVLPRIPKRKPVTDHSSTAAAAPVGETSSYYSVLERVNSAPSSEAARYPNWSAAGWSRSTNIDRNDRLVRRWSRKTVEDKKTESKPIRRSVTEKQSKIGVKRKAEMSENKTKQAAKHLAWSPDAGDVSDGQDFSETDEVAVDEEMAPSLPGPLPTLPFEEQMRERARLRSLKKQAGSCIGNDSSDVTETSVRSFDSNDSSKDAFDSSVYASLLPEKTQAGKLAVRQEQQDFKVPSSENSTSLLQAKRSVGQRSSHQHASENGQKVSGKPSRHVNKPSAADKASQLHITRKDNTRDTKGTDNNDGVMTKLTSSSPPLPHLPVLPLFATSVSETSDSSSRLAEKKTASSSGKKTLATLSLFNRSSSAGNDGSAYSSKEKPAASAASAAVTTAAKSVAFNSSKEIHAAGGEVKKKSKSNVS